MLACRAELPRAQHQSLALQVIINNLDALIMEPAARATLAGMATEAPHLLAEVEAQYKGRFQAAGDLAVNALGPVMPAVQQGAACCRPIAMRAVPVQRRLQRGTLMQPTYAHGPKCVSAHDALPAVMCSFHMSTAVHARA